MGLMSCIELHATDKAWLLKLARNSIGHYVTTTSYPEPIQPCSQAVEQVRACFVTLRLLGGLRGCIGHLEPIMTLNQAVIENAIAAACRDYRFNPLSINELTQVVIDISVLSPQQRLIAQSKQDLLAQLSPSIDGLVIQYRNHKATFLPSVWQQLPEPEQFLQHLMQKAGLAQDFWNPDIQCYRYQTSSFSESVDF